MSRFRRSKLHRLRKRVKVLEGWLQIVGAKELPGGGIQIKKNLYVNFVNEQMRRDLDAAKAEIERMKNEQH